MSEPNTAPLAVLLASHPEECADAVAFLAIRTPHIGVSPREAKAEGLVDILDALCGVGVAVRGERSYWLASDGESRAIARMGAAAWLAARVAPCG